MIECKGCFQSNLIQNILCVDFQLVSRVGVQMRYKFTSATNTVCISTTNKIISYNETKNEKW